MAGTSIMVTETDERGEVWRFEYDAADHLIVRTDPLGNRTIYTYDGNGNQTSMTDANGHAVEFEYDHLNRRTRLVYDDDSADESVWDALGRRVATVDQNGRRTVAYTYDPAGNRTAVTTATGTTLYRFDAAKRLVEVESAAGIHRFGYDPAGNRTSIEYANGTSAAFLYDSLDRLTGPGPRVRPTQRVDARPSGLATLDSPQASGLSTPRRCSTVS